MNTKPGIDHRFPDLGSLADYVTSQVSHCTPDISQQDRDLIAAHLPNALSRLAPILQSVLAFEAGIFNHLNSLQHCSFLYLLSNEIWLNEGVNDTSERLFLLNRCLNSVDIYYKIRLPKVFLIGHGLGSVLVNTHYGENFIFFHNVTVGRIGDKLPRVGDNVILFSGSRVLGESSIGDNSVVSAGTTVIDAVVPPDSIAFSNGSQLVVKPRKKNYWSLYLQDT